MNSSKIVLLVLATIVATMGIGFLASCGSSPEDMLVGKWEGTSPDNASRGIVLVFKDDGSMVGWQTRNGEIRESQIIDGHYTFNFTTDPMQLDIHAVERDDPDDDVHLYAIVAFTPSGDLQLWADDDERPTELDVNSRKYMLLKRIE